MTHSKIAPNQTHLTMEF